MYNPKISVIIATLNSEQYIERAINSILEQTFPNFEIIIVDGISTDKTAEKVLGYGTKIKEFVQEKDSGIYDAFNKGIKYATGDWICFLGSDDAFYNREVLTLLVPHFKKVNETEFGYIYGQALIVAKNGSEIELAGYNWEKASRTFHKAMNINHCGAFTRASVFKTNGNFNTDFKIAGDYEFLLRVFKNGIKPYFVEMPFVRMQTGGVSNNFKLKQLLVNESMMAQRLNNFNPFNSKTIIWYLKIKASTIVCNIFGEKKLYSLADVVRGIIGKKKKWTY